MVYPPFLLKVQTDIPSSRQTASPAFSALFPELESVPEKRFSGQNLSGCFWIVAEDWPNILFPQASVNPSIAPFRLSTQG
jgi:hypothetical protein